MRARLQALAWAIWLLGGGCFGDSSSSIQLGDAGVGNGAVSDSGRSDQDDAGSADEDAGGPVYEPPKCHQTCQDYLTGYAVSSTVWFLYNQNIPGLPGGSVDVSVACPLGGTAHITGTATGSVDGTTTVHLMFELAACRNTAARYSLTFDGIISMDGNFNTGTSGAAEFTAVAFASDELAISGTLKYLDDPKVDETCAVQQTQGTEGELQGQVCDREFSSETALAELGAGQPAADGGASGSGGGDCTCYCGWPENLVCTQNSDCPPDTSVPGTSVPGACGCPVGCKP
jgi:hypothetical protein